MKFNWIWNKIVCYLWNWIWWKHSKIYNWFYEYAKISFSTFTFYIKIIS